MVRLQMDFTPYLQGAGKLECITEHEDSEHSQPLRVKPRSAFLPTAPHPIPGNGITNNTESQGYHVCSLDIY